MTNKKQPPETEEELKKRLDQFGDKALEGLFQSSDSDFDEIGLASGSEDLLEKSDAELFPDEIEEYTPEERKPRIIVDNDKKDKNDKVKK